MIDIPFVVFLLLLALMLGVAIMWDFRRRVRVARNRRERELREVMRETIRDPAQG